MPLRIDLFTPSRSQYNVLHHFTTKFYEALSRHDCNCRLLTFKDNPGGFLSSLLNLPPDASFTFNGLIPDNEGIFLCDMLKIPHVSFLVDSPNIYFQLIRGNPDTPVKSHFNILTSVDRTACAIFRELGFPHIFFLPHGTPMELKGNVEDFRPYEVVVPATPINYRKLESEWENLYPEPILRIIKKAAEFVSANPQTSYFRAFAEAAQLIDHSGKLNKEIIRYYSPLCSLEIFLRGKERLTMIESIQHAKVHLYGISHRGFEWKELIHQSNCEIHGHATFEESFEIMKKSKIVLNSCAWIHDGGHERVFSAMACGALVFTPKNPYLEEHFKDKEEIIYVPNNWSNLDEMLEYYLKNEPERIRIAANGQKRVLENHTWDARARVFIENFRKILNRF